MAPKGEVYCYIGYSTLGQCYWILKKEYLPSYNVGTFFKPKKKLINNLLKENGLKSNPFFRNGWCTNYSASITVDEALNELYEKDVFVSRTIKLIKIKKLLNKRMKRKKGTK